jgi:hypothetical protein
VPVPPAPSANEPPLASLPPSALAEQAAMKSPVVSTMSSCREPIGPL